MSGDHPELVEWDRARRGFMGALLLDLLVLSTKSNLCGGFSGRD
jgi:hypothetical protein